MKFKIIWPKKEIDLEAALSDLRQSRLAQIGKHYNTEIEDYSLSSLYNNIVEVLKEKGIDYEIVTSGRFKPPVSEPGKIILGYHSFSNFPRKNVWMLHTSASAGYFHWDRLGYSSFSEPAKNKKFFIESQETIDTDVAVSWFDEYSRGVKENSISRCAQYGKYHPKRDYVFIAGQLSYDSVLKHKNSDPNWYYTRILEKYAHENVDVVFKKHPAEFTGVAPRYNSIKPPKGCIESKADIHNLIKNAKAVFVINSGVGMEALWHEKPVVVGGSCDYKYVVAKEVFGLECLKQFEYNRFKFDKEKVSKYLYHLHNNVYVNCYDKENIRKKINHAICTYEK